MTERLEYLNSKLAAHKSLGNSSNLSVLEVAKLMDEISVVKERKLLEESLFFSYRKAS